MLPVSVRSSEPLDIVATRNLPLETIYVCRLRGRGKLSVSADRPTPSRILLLSTATVVQGKGIDTNKNADIAGRDAEKKAWWGPVSVAAWPKATRRRRRTGGT